MRGFRRTLFFSHLGLVALTVLLLLFMFRQVAGAYLSEQLRHSLLHNAAEASGLMQRHIKDDGFDVYLTQSKLREVQGRLRQLSQTNGVRFVIISRDLQVLADSGAAQSNTRTSSETVNTVMGDIETDDSNISWGTRREVKFAMQGETNWTVKGSWRDTNSLMTLATPIRLKRNGQIGEVVGCVVTSSPIFVLTQNVFDLARDFFLFVAAIVALVIVLSFALAQRLALPVRRLETATHRLAEGDLSSRVLMHRRFLGRGDELDKLTQEFNAMAEKIEAIDLERRAFLADVSHELRTPLTAIKGSAETLRDGAWKSEKMAPRFADTIVTQSDRLIRLVGDLLKLARLEAATAQNDHTQSRLSTRTPAEVLCERAMSAVRPLFDKRDVQLKLECDAETIRGDEDLLEQLLINLLANAARYSPQGSTTTLSAHEEGNEIVLQVRDEGCGIAPEHLPKLGQRFYRVEEGRERNSSDTGSGLGLAICRRIALAHGGTLDIESQFEEGTVVTVRLRRD